MLLLMIPIISGCGNTDKYGNLINTLIQTQETCLNDDDYSNNYITIKGKLRRAVNSNQPYDGEYTIDLETIIVANNAIYLAETYYQSNDVRYFLFCEIEQIISESKTIWQK